MPTTSAAGGSARMPVPHQPAEVEAGADGPEPEPDAPPSGLRAGAITDAPALDCTKGKLALFVNQLTKRFGERTAFSEVSFQVAYGRSTSLRTSRGPRPASSRSGCSATPTGSATNGPSDAFLTSVPACEILDGCREVGGQVRLRLARSGRGSTGQLYPFGPKGGRTGVLVKADNGAAFSAAALLRKAWEAQAPFIGDGVPTRPVASQCSTPSLSRMNPARSRRPHGAPLSTDQIAGSPRDARPRL